MTTNMDDKELIAALRNARLPVTYAYIADRLEALSVPVGVTDEMVDAALVIAEQYHWQLPSDPNAAHTLMRGLLVCALGAAQRPALSHPSKQEAAREVQERDQFGHTPLEKSIRTTARDCLSDALSRMAELEAERDEAQGRVKELEANGEAVTAEFEGDCWKALHSLLTVCNFDWRDVDPEGIQAEEAREFIATTLDEMAAAEKRLAARAETAEARVKALTKSIVAIKDRAEEDDTNSHAVLEEIAEACTDILSQQGGQTNEA